jgi:hypothetical protein
MSDSKSKKEVDESAKQSSTRQRRSSVSKDKKDGESTDSQSSKAAMSSPLKDASLSSSESGIKPPERPKTETPRDDPRCCLCSLCLESYLFGLLNV